MQYLVNSEKYFISLFHYLPAGRQVSLFVNNDLLHDTSQIIADDDGIDAIGCRAQVDILMRCSHDIDVSHLKDLYAKVVEDPDIIIFFFCRSEHQGKLTFVGVWIEYYVCNRG